MPESNAHFFFLFLPNSKRVLIGKIDLGSAGALTISLKSAKEIDDERAFRSLPTFPFAFSEKAYFCFNSVKSVKIKLIGTTASYYIPLIFFFVKLAQENCKYTY